jgi:hypothetical protein
LRQKEQGGRRPDKLPGMTDCLAQRTFGRVVVGRKMAGHRAMLSPFGKSRTGIGVDNGG